MLDVRRMTVLRAVVTSGSVTAAATNLGYTPSAISQQITALERETGLALLEKSGRGVRPTQAGQLLSDHAGVITAKLAEAERALDDLREGRTGRLGVSFFATAGAALVPPAVAAFREEHPTVRLDLTLRDPESPLDEVVAGRADLAVVVLFDGELPPGIVGTHLVDDPYRLVLPKGHPLASKRVVDLGDLAHHPLVDSMSTAGPCRQAVLEACAQAGFSPGYVVSSNDFPTAMGFVAAGLGLTLVPKLGLEAVPPGVVVRRVRNPEPVRRIHAATREANAGHPMLQALLRSLQQAARATTA
ncbi:DNA-binding transcriptional LysR family regulator [Crossiella equi]|uniref:DNA-binding transcriptional LysR family regulator n=1 Tax=Crossiella equi TaxID=130796 RepID=A0ABS5AIN3_9PSEU|nr:LysR family transcriptional regulator [Crossiella equi]MBP2476247.1 DNA-binding transcriptional LysR family regulator [Crossiella equi]